MHTTRPTRKTWRIPLRKDLAKEVFFQECHYVIVQGVYVHIRPGDPLHFQMKIKDGSFQDVRIANVVLVLPVTVQDYDTLVGQCKITGTAEGHFAQGAGFDSLEQYRDFYARKGFPYSGVVLFFT